MMNHGHLKATMGVYLVVIGSQVDLVDVPDLESTEDLQMKLVQELAGRHALLRASQLFIPRQCERR